MKRVQSLTKSQDFERVMARGMRARRGCATVFALRRPVLGEDPGPEPGGGSRLGVAMSARKRAVVRNRGKRRLRAAFLSCDPAPGYDVVVASDERAASSSFPDLLDDLAMALQEAGVRTGP